MPDENLRPRLKAVIIGGGLIGCITALELAKRNFLVDVYEKQSDPRTSNRISHTLALVELHSLECHSQFHSIKQIMLKHGVILVSFCDVLVGN